MPRIAVITGASSGIGKELAIHFSQNGIQVVLVARSIKHLSEVEYDIKRNGGSCIAVPTDVSSPDDVLNLKKQISHLGTVDILINNAGLGCFGSIEDLSIEDWNRQINVNLSSSFLLSKAFVPDMQKAKKGALVFVNSIAGRKPFRNSIGYVTSKFALRGFSNSLREDLRSYNIKVISIYPGSVDTPFWENVDNNFDRKEMLDAKTLADSVFYAINAPGNFTIEEMVVRRVLGDF
tara:strand:+ start:724 stop:1428 length:705 start_codon:yes stop_codon:yes gene_type:complete